MAFLPVFELWLCEGVPHLCEGEDGVRVGRVFHGYENRPGFRGPVEPAVLLA